jgi:outer membrane protein TolC
MVESAWQRSPQARALVARQDEAAAEQDLADSWLAAPPVLGLSQRNDRWTDDRGRRESEVALSSTIWTPGQKTRRVRYAKHYAIELDAQREQTRLLIAGQVRARFWEAAAAQEALLEKEDHLQHLQELARDVDRRVKAGDLPRSDTLLAQQEVLVAQSAAIMARGNAKAALAGVTLLTGLSALPPAVPEPAAAMDMPVPVRLHAAEAAEQRARSAIAAASAQSSAAPTIALSMRRERDGVSGPNDRSIGIALQIPLVGSQRNRSLEKAAATQLAAASAELVQTRAEVEAAVGLAQSRLRDAEQALDLAEQRVAAAHEHTRLFEKAFALGESPLSDLLRSRTQSHEAGLAVRQQRIALGQARAELNQALGIIP